MIYPTRGNQIYERCMSTKRVLILYNVLAAKDLQYMIKGMKVNIPLPGVREITKDTPRKKKNVCKHQELTVKVANDKQIKK